QPGLALFGEGALGLLGMLALGDVAGHLRESAEPAGSVVHGGDDDVGPEPRAVVPKPPALVLDAPLSTGDLQFPLRLAAAQVFLAVERREVPADDLLRLVALDALGPGVPGGDVAVGVEHEDRVVAHRRHEELEDLRALPQLLLGPLAGGHVAGDLRESADA